MFNDAFDPAARDSALLPLQRRTLEEANRLFDGGQPGQAAPLYAKLAEVLSSASQPRRAASLHAQAAQAFARHREESGALTQARAALNLFLQYKLLDQASVFYGSLNRELTKRGLSGAVQTLTHEFGSRVPPEPKPAGQAVRLPANCPQCGAPVRSDAPDVSTLVCAYCGTPIRPLD